VTGRLEGGTSIAWSQGELRLPGPTRIPSAIELTTLSTFLGLVSQRTTFLGVELGAEWAVSDFDALQDVLL
ncbi:MAG: hypothetical protein GWN82_15485, partial [Gemmatimonadetes bacterium]|nr:hypothetical protein [Gemmatimonadota bacterium]NIU32058.1 hypothetical protein [Gemmatimonadota bacterium]NIV62429.1 hypothetical protein [Gemmatimonadota bacterium]NIW65162.1 hypothetical protein [Gemmatimonadota bacterium]